MKSRFCPSPTGHMHLGNVRTALFNYLAAFGHDGQFLLRIEDTDQARSERALADELMHDLQWLGLVWHEGPGIEGPAGPYWQSERQATYDAYYAQLETLNAVYPCFCSDADLAIQRKVQQAAGQPPRYNGACRHLSKEQIAEKHAQGLQPTLRFRVPDEGVTCFDDIVKGPQEFQNKTIGDFIVRRADGGASFLFCNAIDDALMNVTCALRGEDHLSNTPRQLLILSVLGLKAPQYGHISLILGHDGAPLSKRNGSLSVKELREQGYLPVAVRNYLGRLGHYYEHTHLLTESELASHFQFKHLGTAPARFDPEHLLHWQKESVLRLSTDEFWAWCQDACQDLVPTDKRLAFVKAVQGNVLFPSEVAQWAHIFFGRSPWSDEVYHHLNDTALSYCQTAQALLMEYHQEYFTEAEFKAFIQTLGNCLQVKGKALYGPLRLVFTGVEHGPDLASIASLLPVQEMSHRFARIIE